MLPFFELEEEWSEVGMSDGDHSQIESTEQSSQSHAEQRQETEPRK